jgi:WD40 repeat protein
MDATSGRIVQRLQGHTSQVHRLAVSEDGRLAASGDFKGEVRLWDLTTMRSLRTIMASQSSVTGLHFARGRPWLVTLHGPPPAPAVSASGAPDLGDMTRALVWRHDTGERVATLEHGAPVGAVAIDSRGRWLATAGTSRALKLWDVQKLRLEREFDAGPHAMSAVAFTADGQALLAVDNNLALRRWDLAQGTMSKQAARLPEVTMPAETSERQAWFDPQAQRAVLADRSGVRIIDLADPRAEQRVPGVPFGIHEAVFSRDGLQAALSMGDGSAYVVDLASGQLRHRLRGHADNINGLEFTPDGLRLVTGGTDGTVRLWDLGRTGVAEAVVQHTRAVTQAVWHDTAQWLASGGADGRVLVTDAQGRIVRTLDGSGRVSALAFSGDGRRLLVGRYDNGGAQLWDLGSGRRLLALKGRGTPHEVLEQVDFSPDERIVVAVSGDHLLRWDAASGEALPALASTPGGEKTPNEQLLGAVNQACGYSRAAGLACMASASPGVSTLWNVVSGQPTGELAGHAEGILHARVSDDGRWWAVSDGQALEIWELATRTRRVRVVNAGWTMALNFSRDGSRVATTGGEAAAPPRSWDVRTGKLLAEFVGHANTVESARYSPDGRLLVTASADYGVRIWHAHTGQPITSFDVHSGMVFDAGFSGDGQRIFTASNDGTARILDCRLCVDLDALRRLAAQRVPRTLSPRERALYLHE